MSLIDSILESYAAPDGARFEVVLPKGETLVFRALASYAELSAFKKGAQAFADAATGAGAKNIWKEDAPDSREEAIVAFTIAELSVEPKFSQLQALKLLRSPWIVEHIMGRIDANRWVHVEKFAESVEEEKKGSRKVRATKR